MRIRSIRKTEKEGQSGRSAKEIAEREVGKIGDRSPDKKIRPRPQPDSILEAAKQKKQTNRSS